MVCLNELRHHGILGQKWGVRRYQNADGSLTAKGRERVSKAYTNRVAKAHTAAAENFGNFKREAFQRANNYLDYGGLKQFNEQEDAKLGRENANAYNDVYNDDMNKLFNEVYDYNLDQLVSRFIQNNEDYQFAQKLCDKFNMVEWDEVAKYEAKTMNESKNASWRYERNE